MPTAASGAKLLLPQLSSQRSPKVPLLALRSPRCTVREEVCSVSVTPRYENLRVSDKSREFIETVATPREFQNDMESRYL
jgi:hypothetical protein